MPSWTDYTKKQQPSDNDLMMIEDVDANVNKRLEFSGLADWIVEKLKKNNVISGALKFKGSSAYASLPTNPEQNDYYYSPDGNGTDGAGYYAWDGTAWIFIGNNDKGVDSTFTVEGAAADSKAVGDKFAKVDSETASLKEDLGEFYKPISDLDSKDVDLFISDSYGNVLAIFKDGGFITKEFNTVKSIGNNICDTLEDCDLAISDVQGNVVFCVVNGNVVTSRYNTENHHYSTFSILGDSYSTFKDYTDPLNNLQWYPPSDSATQGSDNDVENVENTWWYLFANDYKSLLVQNNSYSGSCISYDSYGTGTVDGKNFSFVKRCENLKKAELIIVEGGTNDAWANVSLGEYKYAGWTESDFETFRPACSYVLDYIKRNNIGAKVIFILNDGLKSSITESIKNICNHYNVDVLELSNIKKSNKHPNIEGMKQIKEQLINFLLRG